MAYTPSTLENTYSQIDGVWNTFRYISTDAIGTIIAAGYITDYKQHRMNVGDFVWVVNQTTPVTYLCHVASVSSTANTATLAQIGTAESPTFTSVTISGTLSVTGATTQTGNLLASGTVSVTGATTLGSTASVTGATTLGGTVNTTGATTIGSATSTVVGFYGAAGTSQRSSSNQTSSNAAVSASFGASQLAILQEIMNTLNAAGIWKGT